jgi:hypothetical protein
VIAVLFCSIISCGSDKMKDKQPAIVTTHFIDDSYKMIEEGKVLLKECDLVVRLNKDITSGYIRAFNRKDPRYSHGGLVFFENEQPFVFHILMGEDNPDGKLRKDSFHHFCNPERNASYGIYRYNLGTAGAVELKKTIYGFYEREIKFDSLFNLKTDDLMYCSEMIKKALARSTKNGIIIPTTALTEADSRFLALLANIPELYTRNLEIVAIDNLYINPHCRLIREYKNIPELYTRNLEIVAIDNLYINPHCRLIREYKYPTDDPFFN